MLGPIVCGVGLLIYLMQGHSLDNATIFTVGLWAAMVAGSALLGPRV